MSPPHTHRVCFMLTFSVRVQTADEWQARTANHSLLPLIYEASRLCNTTLLNLFTRPPAAVSVWGPIAAPTFGELYPRACEHRVSLRGLLPGWVSEGALSDFTDLYCTWLEPDSPYPTLVSLNDHACMGTLSSYRWRALRGCILRDEARLEGGDKLNWASCETGKFVETTVAKCQMQELLAVLLNPENSPEYVDAHAMTLNLVKDLIGQVTLSWAFTVTEDVETVDLVPPPPPNLAPTPAPPPPPAESADHAVCFGGHSVDPVTATDYNMVDGPLPNSDEALPRDTDTYDAETSGGGMEAAEEPNRKKRRARELRAKNKEKKKKRKEAASQLTEAVG